MHFPDQRLIFIHVPKTGGNFLTRCLAPYAPDRIVYGGARDGLERFEVRGPRTKSKHQPLGKYHDLMGARLARYRVVAIARPPVERLMSLYFSPNRWAGADREIAFSEAEFRRLVAETPNYAHYLDGDALAGQVALKRPVRHASGAEVWLLPFGDMAGVLERLTASFGFPPLALPRQPINQSAHTALKSRLLRDQGKTVRGIIDQSHHAGDMAMFETV